MSISIYIRADLWDTERMKHQADMLDGSKNTIAHCPTRISAGNATHMAFTPVYCRDAIAYMSGAHQATEIQFSPTNGFTVIRWGRIDEGNPAYVEIVQFSRFAVSSVWRTLEQDVLYGAARLTDRAAVRGVGGKPENRVMTRATDDLGAVVLWIRRNEKRLEKLLVAQKNEIADANKSLMQGEDEENLDMTEIPDSYESAMIRENGGNRIANFNRTPIAPLSSPFWDADGEIMQRGKKVTASLRAIQGRKSMIARLRDSVTFQMGKYQENMENEDESMAAIFLEMAQETEARANVLQGVLNAKMAVARAARAARKAIATAEVAVESK